MRSIIHREIRALALHQRLFSRLANRLDIISPEKARSSAKLALPRCLIAGLDYDAEPGTGGLPLPTGGRYRKLCFSPLIQELAETSLDHLGVHRLPTSEQEYLDYVHLTTGIAADCAEALDRLYRLDASMLFRQTEQMRQEKPQAWSLLLSNEFALAEKAWPALGNRVAGLRFKHPLVNGFQFFAEVERGSLIMRHLARASAIIDRPRLLAALQSAQPLAQQFEAAEVTEVYRLLEYASLSTEAIRNILVDLTIDQILALPEDYMLWAAARGSLPSTVKGLFDDPQIRKIMIDVFTLPPREDGAPDRRKEMLRDDQIVRWYGMTNEVLPVLILEGARARFPIRRAAALPGAGRHEDYRVALAKLAGSMRQAWDPKMHQMIEQGSFKYIRTANQKRRYSPKDVTFEANLKLGSKRAKRYLPATSRLGSAARFDSDSWTDPYADEELWSILLGHKRPAAKHNIEHPERKNLKSSLTVLGRTFAPIFSRAESSSGNLEIACQMGVAYSPISANAQIAFSIARLDVCPDRRKRLGVKERGAG